RAFAWNSKPSHCRGDLLARPVPGATPGSNVDSCLTISSFADRGHGGLTPPRVSIRSRRPSQKKVCGVLRALAKGLRPFSPLSWAFRAPLGQELGRSFEGHRLRVVSAAEAGGCLPRRAL